MSFRAPLIILACAAVLDRIVKQLALSGIVEGVFVTREFFGLVSFPPVAGIAIALAACAAFALHLAMNRSRQVAVYDAAILFGAMSNLFDRIAYGGVVDWLPLANLTVLNGSDMLIVGGAMGLFYQEFVTRPPEADQSLADNS
ncbi:signal peptidase II [Candidatus Uhrbacteria bacterium]|nr:signal peptidase II [Candidatus Uhrbacteria bacterium]